MSLAIYMVGFILFLSVFSSGVIWGAVVAGVPLLYIAIAALIILGIGVLSVLGSTQGNNFPD